MEGEKLYVHLDGIKNSEVKGLPVTVKGVQGTVPSKDQVLHLVNEFHIF